MEKTFLVQFDFTTVHGNKFIGRSGQLQIETQLSKKEVIGNTEGLQSLCAEYIHSQKPKWKILMISIMGIHG